MRRGSYTAAILVGLAALSLHGCKIGQSGSERAAPGIALGIDQGAMDKSVKPGDDFYAFANGSWQKTAKIPADRANIGGFYFADKRTEQQLGDLIGSITRSNAATDTPQGKIKAFYNAWLDTAAIDRDGMAPIKPDLDRFAAISDVRSLTKVLGEQLRADVDPLNSTDYETENLFGIFVTQPLAGGEVMPYILQGGLGMPEREYYLSADPKMAGFRIKYLSYIADILKKSGIPDANAKAQRIYDLELRIAQAHMTRAESEDIPNNSAQWSRSELTVKAPGIEWDALLTGAGLNAQQKFAAYHAAAITRLSALVASEPLEAWKDWLIFHQINANAEVLPEPIRSAHFAFFDTALQGTEAPLPRPKLALKAVNAWLGDALGKLYVEQHFPASAKAEIEGMVSAIKEAFAKRIESIDWMDPKTRQEALAKVRTIEVGVGYPDRWKDYTGLALGDKAYANLQAARKFAYAQQLAKIGQPLDKREWWMNAQLVNAVNLPVQNGLNFPAAILQRPFFDPAADPAYNYGAIGAVIGHEISHSFDNSGAAFDSTGKMRNWWTQQDLERFDASGKALADQYAGYAPFPGLHVNGTLTLGENIADVAGLAAAYDAWRASLEGKEPAVIEGFSGDQRFFIAYAQVWATKMRDEALRKRIATDGHAPGMYRALTVRNLDAWYKAFDVQPGDKLYLAPEKRVKIW